MTEMEFKNWMAEYLKSERFDAKLIMDKLKSVHYYPKKNEYSFTQNSNVVGTMAYKNSNTTYDINFKYDITI